jgi:hypothetical protein
MKSWGRAALHQKKFADESHASLEMARASCPTTVIRKKVIFRALD